MIIFTYSLEWNIKLKEKEPLIYDVVTNFDALTNSFKNLVEQLEKAKREFRSIVFKNNDSIE